MPTPYYIVCGSANVGRLSLRVDVMGWNGMDCLWIQCTVHKHTQTKDGRAGLRSCVTHIFIIITAAAATTTITSRVHERLMAKHFPCHCTKIFTIYIEAAERCKQSGNKMVFSEDFRIKCGIHCDMYKF